jgi:hypothetical protein
MLLSLSVARRTSKYINQAQLIPQREEKEAINVLLGSSVCLATIAYQWSLLGIKDKSEGIFS